MIAHVLGTPSTMHPPAPVRERERHELLLVDSLTEAVPALVSCVHRAVDRGDTVQLHLQRALAEAVMDNLEDSSNVTRFPPPRAGTRPTSLMTATLERAQQSTASGERLTLVHQAPPIAGQGWWEWTRVEAAVNILMPVTATEVCLYEKPRLSQGQLDRLLATHPTVEDGAGPHRSPSYQEPEALLERALAHGAALEPEVPFSSIVDPGLPEARSAVRRLARSTEVADDDVAALVFAVTEVLTNARTHGRRPVTVRLWASPRRLTVAVHDAGPGPSDPLTGLVRLGEHSGLGNGLWLAHAMADVRHHRSADGYTAYVSVGED